MSAKSVKIIKLKQRTGQFAQLSFYLLVSFWLLASSANTLILNKNGFDPLTLESIKNIDGIYYIIAVISAPLIALFFICLPARLDKFLLARFISLSAVWIFLFNFWYICIYTQRSQDSLSLALGLVVISLLALFSSRYYLLQAREKGILFYLGWLIFVLFLLFSVLITVEMILALFSASDAAAQDLGIKLVLSFVLALQGAIAGLIAAHLFPDVRIIGRARLNKQKSKLPLYVFLAFIVHCLLFSWILAARTNILATPSFDFGIFSQMFHNMASSGLPNTTLERSYELSHFSVHLSPIFYLLLPLYWLSKSPVLLQISQIVIVATGVIPLILIAKKLNWPQRRILVFALLYLSHPAFSGSSMYDLHENCFLAPLILWLLYFVLKEQIAGIYIMAVLILSVKEDAAIYVIIIAFWLFITERIERIHSSIILFLASLWFVFAIFHLSMQGVGLMTERYVNLMAWPELGLLNLISSFILNPIFVLSQIFTPEKLIYILKILTPLAFLPFLRKIHPDHIMLLPWLLVNLLPAYSHQYNINFQYHYGTVVLLIFVAMLSLDEIFKKSPNYYLEALPRQAKLKQKQRAQFNFRSFPSHYASRSYQYLCLIMGIIMATSLFFGYRVYKEHRISFSEYKEEIAIAKEMKLEMDEIPKSASVRASTMLTTYLSKREKLIDLFYEDVENAEQWEADYIVIDQRFGRHYNFEERIEIAIARGYLIKVNLPEKILILQHPDIVN